MTGYLSRPGFDFESRQAAVNYDQQPNWSGYFGEMIFRHMPLKSNLCVLDVGCGTGYPTLELSQRLGASCRIHGIDIWRTALRRAQDKIRGLEVSNVSLSACDAEALCFIDQAFDLIVSNVGINNFGSPEAVFRECCRVAKPDALLAVTTNPRGHMAEFYAHYEATLKDFDLESCLTTLEKHLAQRHSVEAISEQLQRAGFTVTRVLNDAFTWRFLNGTAFLNTFHIVYGFLQGWKAIVPESRRTGVFAHLEARLNAHAETHGEFSVTVPVRYIEARKAPR